MTRTAPLLFAFALLTGCASTADPEGAAVSTASADPTLSAPEEMEAVVFEGGWQVGGGLETPIMGGCDGITFSTVPNAWTYDVPNGSTRALVTVEGTSPAGAAPIHARLCVFGLDAGVQSVVGALPLEVELPFDGERTVDIVVHPGNAPPSASAEVTLKVTVQPGAA